MQLSTRLRKKQDNKEPSDKSGDEDRYGKFLDPNPGFPDGWIRIQNPSKIGSTRSFSFFQYPNLEYSTVKISQILEV